MNDEILTPNGMDRIFLLPGELCVTDKPVLMATLLGSCVAVCVYNRMSTAAGMNHFLRNRALAQNEPCGKSGDTSITYLIQALLSKDKKASHLEAKIFGGGEVVASLGLVGGIGADNIIMARKVLGEYKIPIVQEDVGGKQGRKIYFNTKNFSVQVRQIVARHKDYSGRKIRVLIVDDSQLIRKILRKIIENSPEFEVCAEAADAYEARDKLLESDPDVISLDIIMPGLDGLDFLQKIMQYKPTPVVIVSTIAKAGSPIDLRARKLGAIGVIDKENLNLYGDNEKTEFKFLATLKAAAMSIVKA